MKPSATPPPEVILRYFRAANAGEIDAACACFAPHARVGDESKEHVGAGAIRGWIEETTRTYQPTVRCLSSEVQENRVTVVGEVSGNFPGSPLELDYQFIVEGDAISRLWIG